MDLVTISMFIIIVVLCGAVGLYYRGSKNKTSRIVTLEHNLHKEQEKTLKLTDLYENGASRIEVLKQELEEVRTALNKKINKPFLVDMFSEIESKRERQLKLLKNARIRVESEELFNLIKDELAVIDLKIKTTWKEACWIYFTEHAWVVADSSKMEVLDKFTALREVYFLEGSLEFYPCIKVKKTPQEEMREDVIEADDFAFDKQKLVVGVDLALEGADKTSITVIKKHGDGKFEVLKTMEGKSGFSLVRDSQLKFLKEGIKIRSNSPEQSMKIQDALFALGVTWSSNEKYYKHLNTKGLYVKYSKRRKKLSLTRCYKLSSFKKAELIEVVLDESLGLFRERRETGNKKPKAKLVKIIDEDGNLQINEEMKADTNTPKELSKVQQKTKFVIRKQQINFVLGKRIEIKNTEHFDRIMGHLKYLGWDYNTEALENLPYWVFVSNNTYNKELSFSNDEFSWEKDLCEIMEYDDETGSLVEEDANKQIVVNSPKILTQKQIISDSKIRIIDNIHSTKIQRAFFNQGATWNSSFQETEFELRKNVAALYCRKRGSKLILSRTSTKGGFRAGTRMLAEICYNPTTELFEMVEDVTGGRSQVDIDREQIEIIKNSKIRIGVEGAREILKNLFMFGAVWQGGGQSFELKVNFLYIEAREDKLIITLSTSLKHFNDDGANEIKYNFKTNSFEKIEA